MKKSFLINGDLQEAVINGGTIIESWNGEFQNTALVQYLKGSEWAFGVYQDLPSIDSSEMCLMTELNFTRKKSLKHASDKHYENEIHQENMKKREAKNNPLQKIVDRATKGVEIHTKMMNKQDLSPTEKNRSSYLLNNCEFFRDFATELLDEYKAPNKINESNLDLLREVYSHLHSFGRTEDKDISIKIANTLNSTPKK